MRTISDWTSFVTAAHPDQRRALAELLGAQAADLPIERVFFAFDAQRPAAGTAVTRVPRISLPLTGRHPFEVNLGDGPAVLRLAPGEALFMLPGSWRRALFDETRTHSAIVFEGDHVCCFAQHCSPAAPTQPQLWVHTAQPLAPEGLDLVHALGGIGRSGRNLEVAASLVRSLIQIVHAELADDSAGPGDPGEAMWRAMCAHIREHYRLPLDRDAIAGAFDVHPNHVSRLFRRHGGEGFNRVLMRTRLEQATRLLRHSACTIEEVALRSGFSDDHYFRYAFRRYFGVPPGRLRQNREP